MCAVSPNKEEHNPLRVGASIEDSLAGFFGRNGWMGGWFNKASVEVGPELPDGRIAAIRTAGPSWIRLGFLGSRKGVLGPLPKQESPRLKRFARVSYSLAFALF